jgi:hypothetical protein
MLPANSQSIPEKVQSEEVKYTIITLENPERYQHRKAIHEAMAGHEYVPFNAVDGRNPQSLANYEDYFEFKYLMNEWRPGELGLWYSNINIWNWQQYQTDPLLVFEDDALLRPVFREVLDNTPPPKDFDFASYYTPIRNPIQAGRFYFEETINEHGNICMMYSAKGANRILTLLEKEGIEYPVDIWLYKQAKFRKTLKGYSPRHLSHVIIDHDFDVPTNIHEDERIVK